MDDLLAQFQKESGNKVDQQRMNATDINAKIRVANQAGQNPDLLMLNSFAIPPNAVAGILEQMEESLLADKGFKASDFSPKAPTTRDELLASAKKLTNGDVYGFSLGAGGDINPFEVLLWQNGANVFSNDFSKAAIGDQPAVDVRTWYGSLLSTEKVAPPIGVDELKAFTAGKIGMWIGGSWNVSGFMESKLAFTRPTSLRCSPGQLRGQYPTATL